MSEQPRKIIKRKICLVTGGFLLTAIVRNDCITQWKTHIIEVILNRSKNGKKVEKTAQAQRISAVQ